MEIGLSLGSNLGDRLANLCEARRRICAFPLTRAAAQSAVYETAPVETAERFAHLQFLNAVLVAETGLKLCEFAELCSKAERDMGRLRDGAEPGAPRVIDIDIIYADSIGCITKELVVPHPRWAGRAFVLRPLAEVRPELLLPGAAATAAELAARTALKGIAVFARQW